LIRKRIQRVLLGVSTKINRETSGSVLKLQITKARESLGTIQKLILIQGRYFPVKKETPSPTLKEKKLKNNLNLQRPH